MAIRRAICRGLGRRFWMLSGVLSVVLIGCAPTRSTPLRTLRAAVRPLGGPHGRPVVDTVMVATLVPRAAMVTRSVGGVSWGTPRDDNGPGLARAVDRLRVARSVLRSPLSRARRRELLRAARDARASLLVTTQVVDLRVTREPNGAFAGLLVCALTVGMTLVGIPACMAIPGHTLEAEVELELAIWDVGQSRRVWQQRLRRKGQLIVSSYTGRRAVSQAIARGMNVVYRAALPRLARALVARGTARPVVKPQVEPKARPGVRPTARPGVRPTARPGAKSSPQNSGVKR